jgi:hypothetical protein
MGGEPPSLYRGEPVVVSVVLLEDVEKIALILEWLTTYMFSAVILSIFGYPTVGTYKQCEIL